MRLVYETTGEEVKLGDRVMLSDEPDIYIVKGIQKPHTPASTGRVYVVPVDDPEDVQQAYFPSVIGATWIEREDRGE